MVLLLIRERVPDLCLVVDSTRLTVISQEEVNLEKRGDFMLFYYQLP